MSATATEIREEAVRLLDNALPCQVIGRKRITYRQGDESPIIVCAIVRIGEEPDAENRRRVTYTLAAMYIEKTDGKVSDATTLDMLRESMKATLNTHLDNITYPIVDVQPLERLPVDIAAIESFYDAVSAAVAYTVREPRTGS